MTTTTDSPMGEINGCPIVWADPVDGLAVTWNRAATFNVHADYRHLVPGTGPDWVTIDMWSTDDAPTDVRAAVLHAMGRMADAIGEM
jgi:hypothetical protein